jgi:hypothetical protein
MAAVPIGPFVRFVVFTAATVYSNWDTISAQFDRFQAKSDSAVFGYYVQHIWQMKDSGGSFSDKERAMCVVHWMNTTGGDLDVTWTSADYALVESGFQALWSSLGTAIPNEYKLVEHRWYPYGPGVNGTKANPTPPSRVTSIVSPLTGSGTTVAPHQLASTLTWRTPLRRHWGRIYLPVAYMSGLTAGGQIPSGAVDTLATAGSTYMKSGNANGLTPVVWDRQRRAALGITAVEADSVIDIIRRRRERQTLYRKILTS